MNHGQQTAQAARALARQIAGLGLTVLYDHGQQGVDPPHSLGQIVSWTGPWPPSSRPR